MQINKMKVGLALGIFISFIHLVWLLLVAIMPAVLQSLIDWIFTIHSLKPVYTILPIVWLNALYLIILTFVVGYIMGWLFAFIHNLVVKKE